MKTEEQKQYGSDAEQDNRRGYICRKSHMKAGGHNKTQAAKGRDWADEAREILSLHGVALEKTDPPARIVSGNMVVCTENLWLDFAGVRTRDGRMVVVECKTTAGHVLRIDANGLRPRQLAAMKRWNARGAAVLLAWRSGSRIKVSNWDQIERALERDESGRPKALRFEMLEAELEA